MIPLFVIGGITAAIALFAKHSAASAPATPSASAPGASIAPSTSTPVSHTTENASLFSTPEMEALYGQARGASATLNTQYGIPIQARSARPVVRQPVAPARASLPRFGLPTRRPIAMLGAGRRFRTSLL